MKMMDEAASERELQGVDDAAIRRLAAIDLNLLVVFAAMLQDRSVTLAARRLFVGQPAVSASLKRLRALFADPLFVKAGRGLVVTERALALQPAMNAALVQIDALAFSPPAFDPAAARMTVRIGLSDDIEIVFLPAVAREIQRVAPQVRLVARPVSHTDIRDSLDRGEVDVGVSVFGELSAWHLSEVLFEQGYGCLFDPQVGQRSARLSLDEFVGSEQVIVTFDGALESKVDRILAGQQLRRDIRLGTTRFAALPHLVQGTALVASLPELIGRTLARTHGLAFSPLPFAVPPSLPRMTWHRRNDLDPASRWLRELISNCVRRVVAEVRLQPSPATSANADPIVR